MVCNVTSKSRITCNDNVNQPPLKRLKVETGQSENTFFAKQSSLLRKGNSEKHDKNVISEPKSSKQSHTSYASIFQSKKVVSTSRSSTHTDSLPDTVTSANAEKSLNNLEKTKSVDKIDNIPLPELMRPTSIHDFFGQEHIVGENKLLRKLLNMSQIPSIILWGPPGCGKTTLAKILAKKSKDEHNARFAQLSATVAGIADVKQVINVASNELKMFKRKTVLFIDEIHRFNKLQQDTFLPFVENGTITLIGATTENPSFQVNNALLSRCRVVVLEKLTTDAVMQIIKKSLNRLDVLIVKNKDESDLNNGICIEEDAIQTVCHYCDGDARSALNAIQLVYKAHVQKHRGIITVEQVKEALQRTHIQYDRSGDEHYHCASALQKSIRGSDDNGAIYWMTRMFEGGEDPLFIARRLVVTASEDIGLADPQALPIAVATFQACQLIGRPECGINLAHCTTYLARAPKSNESYQAFHEAKICIKDHQGPLPGVPLHLRNATSKLDREMGYGKGYKYSHSSSGKQDYLPNEMLHKDFFNRKK